MLPQDQETVSTTQNFDEVGKMIHVSMVLKDKVKKMGGSAEGGLSMENIEAAGVVSASSHAAEAVNALAVLGYSPSDAAAVVGKLDSSLPVEELIRLSLRALAPKWD